MSIERLTNRNVLVDIQCLVFRREGKERLNGQERKRFELCDGSPHQDWAWKEICGHFVDVVMWQSNTVLGFFLLARALFSFASRISHLSFSASLVLGFVSYDNPQCAQQGKRTSPCDWLTLSPFVSSSYSIDEWISNRHETFKSSIKTSKRSRETLLTFTHTHICWAFVLFFSSHTNVYISQVVFPEDSDNRECACVCVCIP